MIKRIALIGPESTGKTELCRELAEHFNTVWVPEFARSYIEGLNRRYYFDDVEFCARKQLAEEDKQAAQANRFLFCDTELINFKVWFKDVFKAVPEWIEETIKKHPYDLYLLTYPDLPFIPDSVRENPHRRMFFFEWYERELKQQQFAYETIMGVEKERLRKAVEVISSKFKVQSYKKGT